MSYLWRNFCNTYSMKRDPLKHFHPQYQQLSLSVSQPDTHLSTPCEVINPIYRYFFDTADLKPWPHN